MGLSLLSLEKENHEQILQIYLKFLTAHINSYPGVSDILLNSIALSFIIYSFEVLKNFNDLS
jgi:hypothetical protein